MIWLAIVLGAGDRFHCLHGILLGSIVVSISACHAEDPGSIPGLRVFFPLCGASFKPHSACCVIHEHHDFLFDFCSEGKGKPLKSLTSLRRSSIRYNQGCSRPHAQRGELQLIIVAQGRGRFSLRLVLVLPQEMILVEYSLGKF